MLFTLFYLNLKYLFYVNYYYRNIIIFNTLNSLLLFSYFY